VPYPKICLQLTLLTALRVIAAPLVVVATLIGSMAFLQLPFKEPYVALSIIAALLTLIVMGKDDPFRASPYSSAFALAGQVGLAWLVVIGALLLIGYATKTSELFSRRALFLWFVVTPPVLVAVMVGLRQWMRILALSARNARSAIIVGANKMSLELAKVIRERPEIGLKLHCFFDERCPDRWSDVAGFPLRSDVDQIRDFVNKNRIDVVFIALPVERAQTMGLLNDLRDTTSSVYLIPDISLFDLIQAQSVDIHGVPAIALCESPLQGIRGLVKRATDVVFASLLLIIAAPVMLAIYIAIKVTSKGPAIFKQDRYGLDGERIVVYKFRTMTVAENGDNIVQAKPNDPRVTPLGRFLRRTSLDELPQLINVLQGRMSLVGPRPHAVAHNEQYRRLISGYMVRHKVTPGITGLAQINGCRGETATLEDMKRRVDYDLEYLRHWNWLLDMKILFKTFLLVIRDKHAY
jgi:putative colanic acid biosynthesis UDP-glucose lipid carrier transferase